jgi:hypothetical protein
MKMDDHNRTARRTIFLSLFVAILAAAASVATAVISARSSVSDTKRQIAYQEAQERQDAVGAARVLAYQLVTAEVYAQGALDTNQLIPWDPKNDVQLSQADLKAISASPLIGVDRWQRIVAALSNLDSLGYFVRIRRGQGVRRLGPGETRVLDLQIATIDGALDAMKPLAGKPKLRKNPFGPK